MERHKRAHFFFYVCFFCSLLAEEGHNSSSSRIIIIIIISSSSSSGRWNSKLQLAFIVHWLKLFCLESNMRAGCTSEERSGDEQSGWRELGLLHEASWRLWNAFRDYNEVKNLTFSLHSRSFAQLSCSSASSCQMTGTRRRTRRKRRRRWWWWWWRRLTCRLNVRHVSMWLRSFREGQNGRPDSCSIGRYATANRTHFKGLSICEIMRKEKRTFAFSSLFCFASSLNMRWMSILFYGESQPFL